MVSVKDVQREAQSWYTGKRASRHNFEMGSILVGGIGAGLLALMAGPIVIPAAAALTARKMLGRSSEFSIAEGINKIMNTKDAEVAAAILKALYEKHGK